MAKIDQTELETALAEIGAQRRQRYKQVFQPIEDRTIKDITDVSDELQQARGLSNVDVATQFGGRAGASERILGQNAGVGSGAFTTGLADFQEAGGRAAATGLANTQSQIETNRLSNVLSMVQRGQGQAGNALQGLASSAEASARQAQLDAEAELASRNALRRAAGVGAGLAYYGYNPAPANAGVGLNVPVPPVQQQGQFAAPTNYMGTVAPTSGLQYQNTLPTFGGG